MSGLERVAARDVLVEPRFGTRSFIVGMGSIAASCIVASLVAICVGGAYQRLAYGGYGPTVWHGVVGGIAGLFYTLPFILRGEHAIPAYLAKARRPQRIFMSWNAAFLGLLVLAFLTQTSIDVSRVSAILFYVCGLMAMIALESGMRSAIISGLRHGVLPPRRVMLVGRAGDTRDMLTRLAGAGPESERIGVRVVAVANLPEFGTLSSQGPLASALKQAVVKARAILPDDVVVVTAWDNVTVVDAAVAAFEQLPVAIHLDGGAVISRYHDAHLRKVGGAATLSLAELPLTPAQALAKRIFDVVAATIGLILLLPLFAVIAIAIKLDSRGSVFFRQDRLGFNQTKFQILKFRTMSVADNGSQIEQAKRNDPRITRVGAWLRRTSLDELPQLVNVIRGSMSLVGPRPHAVAHDRDFEQRIRRYPRRLNMKPGITGWAQVNGLRGETDTVEKMQRRVEADLYYIDNWSLMFDAYIILLTVVSPKVFKNAR